MSQKYRVTVFYREPTYELRVGRADRIYRGSFVVQATSPDAADGMARAEFARWAKMSHVNWGREIVETRCVLL